MVENPEYSCPLACVCLVHCLLGGGGRGSGEVVILFQFVYKSFSDLKSLPYFDFIVFAKF